MHIKRINPWTWLQSITPPLAHIEGHFRVSLQLIGNVFGLWEETGAPGENPHKNPKEHMQKKKILREAFLYEATMPTTAATIAATRQLQHQCRDPNVLH